jgi:hypothetical protein
MTQTIDKASKILDTYFNGVLEPTQAHVIQHDCVKIVQKLLENEIELPPWQIEFILKTLREV